jgi:hypothetical protein
LLRDGADSVSVDSGLVAELELEERLVDRRTAGRDLGEAVLGRDKVDFGLAVAAFGFALVLAELFGLAVVRALDAVVRGLAAALGLAVVRALDAVVRGLAVAIGISMPGSVALGLDADLELGRDADVLGLAGDLRLAAGLDAEAVLLVLATAGIFADCMFLAADMSAFAAVDMALLAVFIDVIADDIAFAEAVALVAAAVILVAADETLVAADETFLAAVMGVAELRLAVLLRAALLRTERPALVRRAVGRDAVDRDAVLRVDRVAVLFAAVLRAGFAAVLRAALGLALELRLVDVDIGRLAVPLDALRLTDLLRAVLAELRRVAARVVD